MPLASKPVDLIMHVGVRFYKKFVWKSGGSPKDLSTYKAHMQVRASVESETALLTLSSETITKDGTITLGGAAGTIELEVLATNMANVDWKNAVYDLLVYTSDEQKDILVDGRVTATKVSTRV